MACHVKVYSMRYAFETVPNRQQQWSACSTVTKTRLTLTPDTHSAIDTTNATAAMKTRD